MIKKLQMHFVEIYFILKKVKDRRKNESQYFMIWQLFSSIHSCLFSFTGKTPQHKPLLPVFQ